MITVGWDELAEHQHKGDTKDWIEGKLKADKVRQRQEDLYGVPHRKDCKDTEGDKELKRKNDTISRWAAAKAIYRALKTPVPDYRKDPFKDTMSLAIAMASEIPSAETEQKPGRIFKSIVVEYPSLSTYPERKGKPYFSIKYTENGQEFIGYGTYKPEVLSEYLKEYFMPSAEPEDYTELKQEFIRMAGYIDISLKCPDEQKEVLIGFVTRLAKHMPWTKED